MNRRADLPGHMPPDEAARLLAQGALSALDTAADSVLDSLVRAASAVVGSPISLISLIEERRHWLSSCLGLASTQVPRDEAFCAPSPCDRAIFEVQDARRDGRFADSPLVTGAPHMRFYAGLPLALEGQMIGTLCIVDRQPRRFDDAQRAALGDLAHAVESWMSCHREKLALAESEATRRRLFDGMGDGMLHVDLEHRLLDANPAAARMLGYTHADLLRETLPALLEPGERQRLEVDVPAVMSGSTELIRWSMQHKEGYGVAVELSARPLDGASYVAVLRDVSRRPAPAPPSTAGTVPAS